LWPWRWTWPAAAEDAALARAPAPVMRAQLLVVAPATGAVSLFEVWVPLRVAQRLGIETVTSFGNSGDWVPEFSVAASNPECSCCLFSGYLCFPFAICSIIYCAVAFALLVLFCATLSSFWCSLKQSLRIGTELLLVLVCTSNPPHQGSLATSVLISVCISRNFLLITLYNCLRSHQRFLATYGLTWLCISLNCRDC